jgi:hypothetical protein
MARYYFNFKNGHTALDDHGTEIADTDGLRREAVRATREIFLTQEGVPEFWAGEPARIWVTDGPNATGKTVLTLELSARQHDE